jgi:hypothetical protein
MTARAIAAVAALSLLALPLLARPGNRGRADGTVQTSADEVHTVNTADVLMDLNAANNGEVPAIDAPACQPGDGACLRDEKDIQAAMRDLENAVNEAMNAAEAAPPAAENEAGPERRR